MAVGIMIDIKDNRWTCQKPCNHKDCAANREFIKSVCRICKKVISKGESYFFEKENNGKPIHAICLENNL